MALTRKDVEHVAKLARLALTDQEKEHFTGQLANILGYIEKLQELKSKDSEAKADAAPARSYWREDQARKSGLKEAILANAPEREEDFFKVKKVIE